MSANKSNKKCKDRDKDRDKDKDKVKDKDKDNNSSSSNNNNNNNNINKYDNNSGFIYQKTSTYWTCTIVFIATTAITPTIITTNMTILGFFQFYLSKNI